MKKIILSAIAICSITFANAQAKKTSAKEDMSFGIKGGLNLATITGVDGAKTMTNFHIGGFADFMVSDKFHVQPEILYSGQGANFDGGHYNLNYINVPVMAKYYVADKFSLEAGPQIGFLISAKAKVSGFDSVDVKDNFKSVDFGLNFGLGYDFTDNFSAGVRYNLGLTQLQKELTSGESAAKNSVIQISVGYKF